MLHYHEILEKLEIIRNNNIVTSGKQLVSDLDSEEVTIALGTEKYLEDKNEVSKKAVKKRHTKFAKYWFDIELRTYDFKDYDHFQIPNNILSISRRFIFRVKSLTFLFFLKKISHFEKWWKWFIFEVLSFGKLINDLPLLSFYRYFNSKNILIHWSLSSIYYSQKLLFWSYL